MQGPTPRRTPWLLGLHARPPRGIAVALGLLPFVLLLALYMAASSARLAGNPDDKLLPSIGRMVDTVQRLTLEPDARSGQRLLWSDTGASLWRLALGLTAAATAGLLLGLIVGLFPGLTALSAPLITVVSMVPPLALLPILFIVMGVGEASKVALIFIGVFPVITRDLLETVRRLPREQITKALTLGAGPWALASHVVLPQLMPRLIEALRLSLGAAWLFLIAAEAIASDGGLGYRIFLVRRYLAMDVILPYVLWITLLGFAADLALRGWLRWRYPWYVAGARK